MGWLIALAVIVLIALVPIGVCGVYDELGARAWVLVGPLRWKLYPSRKKAEKTRDKSPQKTEKNQPKSGENPPEKGGNIRDFYPLVKRILDFLGDLRRKLRVKQLQLHLTLAGDDPCDLALNYGRAQAAFANLDPHLERFFVIRKKDVTIDCDFSGDKSYIYGRLDLTVTVARIFSLGFRHGIRILREFMRIMKLRKGGATK